MVIAVPHYIGLDNRLTVASCVLDGQYFDLSYVVSVTAVLRVRILNINYMPVCYKHYLFGFRPYPEARSVSGLSVRCVLKDDFNFVSRQ